MSVLADWLARARVPERCAPRARRALAAIRRCRTPALGGHLYRCTECAGTDFAYHSCHHRACPRCGGERTAAWTAQQEARLLPVPYFLVTFTVPQELRAVFAAEPALMHDRLFRESAATLQQVAAERRLLGAELGFVGVLHTWGRQLQHHPHVHYIVPGGGLSPDGKKWVNARQRDWLLPVAKLAAVFRGRMEAVLRASAPARHASIPAGTWRSRWVVHCQPAGSGEAVVRYLARYVSRTAISDERLVVADDERVVFNYTDTKTQQRRQCTLGAEEFLRRYLQHVPPAGQHRVRYFGWLHPAAHARRMTVDVARQRGDGNAAGVGPKGWPMAGALGAPTDTNAAAKADRARGAAAGGAALALALSALRTLHARARGHAAAAGASAAPLPAMSIKIRDQLLILLRLAPRAAGGSLGRDRRKTAREPGEGWRAPSRRTKTDATGTCARDRRRIPPSGAPPIGGRRPLQNA
ncbi:IS91 family transposase [Horticoccus luteus]|uniref:IS91 family transposase n=1 Tax=Horticoccus luteus TaxID=2862869 RepID=A0A8F9TUB3_9BACT|nr:IS91 family transposase [Horticoccus luteus]QYM77717.1 IS91 family transposase [Horticoccus luteus]